MNSFLSLTSVVKYCCLHLPNHHLIEYSLVGSIVIVVGFYAVMWGKTKEDMVDEDKLTRNINSKAPLLEIKDAETKI